MKKSQDDSRRKISYEKPKILDLGPVTPVTGGVDCFGGSGNTNQCKPGGTAVSRCDAGASGPP